MMVIAAGWIAASCTLKQDIQFNEDFSGNIIYTIDYTDFIAQMGDMGMGSDGSGNSEGMSSKEIKQIEKELNKIDGISNFSFYDNTDEGEVSFKYDFADVAVLDAAMGNSNKMESEERTIISKKGNTVTFDFWGDALSDFDLEDEAEVEETAETAEEKTEVESGFDDMAKMMMESLNYQTVMHFPNKISGVSNSLYKISEDRKSLTLDVQLGEIIASKESLVVEVTF